MHDPLLVRRLERLGDLSRDDNDVRDWECRVRAVDHVFERRPFHQLHDECVDQRAAALLDAVDRRDVRMIERRERLGLALEPGDAVAIGGKEMRQRFDGDVAIEPRVAGAIDLAHATRSQQSPDFVRAEPCTGCECHIAFFISSSQLSTTLISRLAGEVIDAGNTSSSCLPS